MKKRFQIIFDLEDEVPTVEDVKKLLARVKNSKYYNSDALEETNRFIASLIYAKQITVKEILPIVTCVACNGSFLDTPSNIVRCTECEDVYCDYCAKDKQGIIKGVCTPCQVDEIS